MLKIYAFFREEKLIFEILVQGKISTDFVFYIPVLYIGGHTISILIGI